MWCPYQYARLMDMFESEILSFEPSLLPLIKGKYACCLCQQDLIGTHGVPSLTENLTGI